MDQVAENCQLPVNGTLRAYGTGSISFLGCFKRKHVTEFTWLGNFCKDTNGSENTVTKNRDTSDAKCVRVMGWPSR
jgi:hypothetical protein